MMKNQFLLFLCLLFTSFSFGQKEYSFDCILEYSSQMSDTSRVGKIMFYTNSKDNSYFLQIAEKDSLTLRLFFLDQRGYVASGVIRREDLDIAQTFTLSCQTVHHYQNPYAYQVENYNFNLLNDTLINAESYKRYSFKSNDLKRVKKKKLGEMYFVVENNTAFHLPVLLHPTAYEEWKLEKNIPNGIPKIIYFVGYKGKNRFKYTLTDYKKAYRTVVIPEECLVIQKITGY